MTFTATRSQLQQALADCLDWDAVKASGEYDSFAALADAMISSGHFNVKPDRVRVVRPRPVKVAAVELSPALKAECAKAGAALGKWRFDANGALAGVQCKPAPSHSARLAHLLDDCSTCRPKVGQEAS